MTPTQDLGSLYGNVRTRLIEQVIHGLDDADLATVVPTCPAWTVKDVVGHLVGIVDDGLSGNMDGAPGPEWTAAQVAKRSDVPLHDLLDEWDAKAARFEQAISMHGIRPPVLDIASHEQDLRGALGLAGARDNPVILWATPLILDGFGRRVAEAGLPPVLVDLEGDGSDAVVGGEVAGASLRTSRFDLFRAAFGRRSEAQLRAMDWSVDPAPYLPHLHYFGPSPTDIVE